MINLNAFRDITGPTIKMSLPFSALPIIVIDVEIREPF